MMKTYLGIILVLTSFGLSQPNGDSSARDIARAENNFSSASVTNGIKPAFLEFLSDDCVMFNPKPVNGKVLYQNRPANSAQLSWFPTFVEAAASGEMGISTGPWEFRSTKNDTPAAYGHYFSVWEKQSEGTWKVTLDIGVGYPKERKTSEQVHIRSLKALDEKRKKGASALSELSDAEKSFILLSQKNGTLKAYSQCAAENIRVYRKGNFPTNRKGDALKLLSDLVPQKGFFPVVTKVSSSGDLGYTYGYSVNAQNDSSSYVRVWRKENGWKVAVDILETFGTKE